ncbi:hypothetical protein [Clostridium botulinum]|uniref:hypothetical protein n=1 Tax=Clostridium botulinum TaxID=1491 RepID=UPI00249F0A9B|nr:hypothetical protein [Clostridium botulinum]MDU4596482.1 hypothetical protein [Clostridium sporogenes]WGZ48115.1 hypothetical protein HEQ52_18385 [Clostridium botulinum]
MAKRRIQERGYRETIEGQLTIWDVQITKKTTSATKNKAIDTKSVNSITEMQDKVIEKYKNSSELNRIIRYCGGGVGIELKAGDSFRTIYINSQGKEEFECDKKTSVLPMDEILYYKDLLETNDIQEEKLKDIQEKLKSKKVIRRKGDENIIIELEHKVISIIPKGWVLEFQECKAVYKEDEVIKEVEEVFDIEAMRKSIKVGDWVETTYRNRKITGEICRVYGPDNMTLNIIFDNGTKHTAISRLGVLKKL